jgi:hypothetical protein
MKSRRKSAKNHEILVHVTCEVRFQVKLSQCLVGGHGDEEQGLDDSRSPSYIHALLWQSSEQYDLFWFFASVHC